MATRYVHTNLIARDWQRLVAFYVEVFGCVPLEPKRDLRGEWLERGTGVKGAHLRGQHLRLPGHGDAGPTLEVFAYDEVLDQGRPVANRSGFGHIAFAVDDVEAMVKRVVEAGGSAELDVVRSPVPGAGTLTVTYVRDPEGNQVEAEHFTDPHAAARFAGDFLARSAFDSEGPGTSGTIAFAVTEPEIGGGKWTLQIEGKIVGRFASAAAADNCPEAEAARAAGEQILLYGPDGSLMLA